MIEELIRMLGITKINYIYMDYTDDDGNFKTLKLDYRQESEGKE